MATVKAIIRKAKGKVIVNDQGQTLVYIQYGHDSKVALFSTGIKILPKQWSESKCKIDSTKELLKNKANAELIKLKEKEDNYSNANIESFKSKITSLVRKLQHKDVTPTVTLVKEAFEAEYGQKTEKAQSLFDLIDAFIEERKATMAVGTIKHYKSIKNNLLAYQEKKKEKVTLERINLNFYDKFINYLLSEHIQPDGSIGMSNNTVGNQIKNLKAILKYLKKRGHVVYDNLEDFKVMKEKGQIIYLSQEELENLYSFDFSHTPRLERVRDLFVFQCSTGLRISDLLRVGKEHIKSNIIRMNAHKSKKAVIVPLTPKAVEILTKYDYTLPLISEQKVNAYIKECCQLVGISSKVEVPIYKGGTKTYEKYFKHELISTHTAVKTFITHCGEKGIAARVVSEITGKTVKVILDHYYGTNEKVIEMEMLRAFGTPEPILKIS